MSLDYEALGREVRVAETWFRRGTVPSWLDLREDGSYANASIGPAVTPGGGVLLSTSAAASRAVGLIAENVDLTKVKMVEIQAITRGGGDSVTAIAQGFRDTAATAGGMVARNANNGTVYLRSYAPGQVNKDTTFQAWESITLLSSVGYRLYPNEIRSGLPVRRAQLLVDGRVFAQRTFTDAEFPLTSPIVRPEILVSGSSGATGGTARELKYLRIVEVYR